MNLDRGTSRRKNDSEAVPTSLHPALFLSGRLPQLLRHPPKPQQLRMEVWKGL
jgi:hypothetical protein